MFHQAVAEILGLNPTDVECFDLATSESTMTAGHSELTGLTTAAVLTVIDRLESPGFVQSEDSADRCRRPCGTQRTPIAEAQD